MVYAFVYGWLLYSIVSTCPCLQIKWWVVSEIYQSIYFILFVDEMFRILFFSRNIFVLINWFNIPVMHSLRPHGHFIIWISAYHHNGHLRLFGGQVHYSVLMMYIHPRRWSVFLCAKYLSLEIVTFVTVDTFCITQLSRIFASHLWRIQTCPFPLTNGADE